LLPDAPAASKVIQRPGSGRKNNLGAVIKPSQSELDKAAGKAIRGFTNVTSKLNLTNPIARAFDVASNTSKAVSTAVESGIRAPLSRITDKVAGTHGYAVEPIANPAKIKRAIDSGYFKKAGNDLKEAMMGRDAAEAGKYDVQGGLKPINPDVPKSKPEWVQRGYSSKGMFEADKVKVGAGNFASAGDVPFKTAHYMSS